MRMYPPPSPPPTHMEGLIMEVTTDLDQTTASYTTTTTAPFPSAVKAVRPARYPGDGHFR